MPSSFRPNVDIIIPFHGQYESLTKCLASIYACTPNQDYKIILVDDASPNSSYLKDVTQGTKTIGIRLEEQAGFGGALEAGFKKSQSQHILFMHSDVEIKNINWLANLQRGFARMRDQNVKLVSARTDNAGTAANYDASLVGNIEEEVRDTIAQTPLPLFCAYCHRQLFNRIGGFIKPYPYAWYEDEELFWRMNYYGYKQGIVRDSWVKHKGGLTIKSLLETRPKLKSTMENNRALCLEDVRPYLSKKSRQL